MRSKGNCTALLSLIFNYIDFLPAFPTSSPPVMTPVQCCVVRQTVLVFLLAFFSECRLQFPADLHGAWRIGLFWNEVGLPPCVVNATLNSANTYVGLAYPCLSNPQCYAPVNFTTEPLQQAHSTHSKPNPLQICSRKRLASQYHFLVHFCSMEWSF